MKYNNDIVDLIYDVPLGLSEWEAVAQAIKREFNALLGLIYVAPPDRNAIEVSTIPHDESIWKLYEQYYCHVDPWNNLLNANDRFINKVLSGGDFFPHKQFLTTEFYNDFWKPYGLCHTAGGRLVTRNRITIQLSFPRDQLAGPYTLEEANRLDFYTRHIKRGIELEGIIGDSLPQPVYQYALASSYGLTETESRLVLELMKSGSSLPNIARQLNRSYHTVRNQMKSVFVKTETGSRSELFRRLTTRI